MEHIAAHVLTPSMAPFQPARSLEEFFVAFAVQRLSDSPDDRHDIVRLQTELIAEEAREVLSELSVLRSVQYSSQDPLPAKMMAALAKELADLVYVCFHAAAALGIPLEKVFRAVHGSNMSKLEDGKVVRAANGKVLKGKSYKAPDVAALL